MSVIGFLYIAANVTILMILVRLAEMYGPGWVANPLGVVFHA